MRRARWRLARTSLGEVLRSGGTMFGLLLVWSSPWLLAAIAMLLLPDDVGRTRAVYRMAGSWARIAALAGALVVSLDLTTTGGPRRLLGERLVWPLGRVEYYLIRVLSRAVAAAAGAALCATGLWVLVEALSRSLVFYEGEVLGPSLHLRLFSAPLVGFCSVCALAALGTISSSRYGHVLYWLGLQAVAWLPGLEVGGVQGRVSEGGVALSRWVVGPMLFGPDLVTVAVAARGTGHAAGLAAELLWGVGLSLTLGTLVFVRRDLHAKG